MLGDFSVCLVSVGARSAAGSGGTSAVGDLAGEVGGVVLGEGEKSGCEGGGGEAAGEVGVGEGVGSCCCGSACGGLEESCWSCKCCRSWSSFQRAWHCSTEKPTRRATNTQLGRSRGLPLSSTRRQSASPSHASQSACWLGSGGGGCFRLRVVAGFGVGVGEGVSSESLEGGGGKRIGGLEGAESQEEVGDGRRIG